MLRVNVARQCCAQACRKLARSAGSSEARDRNARTFLRSLSRNERFPPHSSPEG